MDRVRRPLGTPEAPRRPVYGEGTSIPHSRIRAATLAGSAGPESASRANSRKNPSSGGEWRKRSRAGASLTLANECNVPRGTSRNVPGAPNCAPTDVKVEQPFEDVERLVSVGVDVRKRAKTARLECTLKQRVGAASVR